MGRMHDLYTGRCLTPAVTVRTYTAARPTLRPRFSAQFHSPPPATPEVSASRSHSRRERGPSQVSAAATLTYTTCVLTE